MQINTRLVGGKTKLLADHCQAGIRQGVSVIAIATALQMACAATARAQENQQAQATVQSAQTPQVEEIIVTGSRVISNGLQSPTPLTVVGVEDLKNAEPGNLAVAITELPVFSSSNSVASTNNAVSTGASSLNLRGIGSSRTLVLLDGRRMAPSPDSKVLTGSPDINLIPFPLIRRVDVVTGGASAAYGSDAVSGVVNLILDTTYEGIKGELQGGVTDKGDKWNYKGSLAAGTSFHGDRGHIIFAAEYNKDNGLKFSDRSFAVDSWAVITNPGVTATTASPTNPLRVTVPNVYLSDSSLGGLITNTALAGIQFGPGGVPGPFRYGTYRSSATMSGGDGVNPAYYGALFAPISIMNAFTHVTYDISDNLSVYAEGMAAKTDSTVLSWPNFSNARLPFTIFRDNYFLPASIQTAMTAKNINSFTLGRVSADFGPMYGTSTTKSNRVVAGIKGQFATDWSFDGYYTHSHIDSHQENRNSGILRNWFRAVDAVVNPATGAAICRTKLQNPNSTDPEIANCVPLNVLGEGSPSTAALSYVLGTEPNDSVAIQDAASFGVNGEPFSTWAGPISVGFGGEYRKESQTLTSDAIANAQITVADIPGAPVAAEGKVGGYVHGNAQSNAGSFSVKEAFVETLVPLAKDATWARALDLNAAARYADYSSSGGVTTWKVGAVYQPIEDLRLRGTRSRDIRAANVSEKFGSSRTLPTTITDPFRNRETLIVDSNTSGNVNLDPEKADTTALGATYQPSWFSGFTTSVDWYNIKIKDAIGALGVQNIVDQCYVGATQLCPLIRRDTVSGRITYVSNTTLNQALFKAEGVDIEVSYLTPLSDIVSSWDGNLNLRLLATHLGKLESTNLGGLPVDRAGQTGGTGGTPHWKAALTANYSNGPVSVFVRERYVGGGLYDTTFGPNDIDNNNMPSRLYTDANIHYKVGADENIEIALAVNNLFDREPPHSGFIFAGISAQPSGKGLYDMVGRAFTLGVSFTY